MFRSVFHERVFRTVFHEHVFRSVFHERARGGGGSELGVAWDLVSDPTLLAGWGRYAVLADYALSDVGFDGSLLAGKDADSDRTAPTDLRLGADVDWRERPTPLGKAVLTAHIMDAAYTLDTDVGTSVRSRLDGSRRYICDHILCLSTPYQTLLLLLCV